MTLSILICTLPTRSIVFDALINNLRAQMKTNGSVEVLTDNRGKEVSTGTKRQSLLERATGDYVVWIDDDDMVEDYYISEMLRGCLSGCDCLAINGYMTTDGRNRMDWYISKDFTNCTVNKGNKKVYLRTTNHITAVKRELALKAGFPDKSNAEDKWYSERVAPLCRTEFKIDKPLYHYRFSTQNKEYK